MLHLAGTAEVLHGFTYAVLWSGCCYYANVVAPDGLKASMQGIVGGVHWGLGVGTGATVGGLVFGAVGGAPTFLGGAALSTIALAVAATSSRRWPSPTRPLSPREDAAVGQTKLEVVAQHEVHETNEEAGLLTNDE